LEKNSYIELNYYLKSIQCHGSSYLW